MKTEELREQFKKETGITNWNFTLLNKYAEWLEGYVLHSEAKSKEEAEERYKKAEKSLFYAKYPLMGISKALRIASGKEEGE